MWADDSAVCAVQDRVRRARVSRDQAAAGRQPRHTHPRGGGTETNDLMI